MDIYPAEKLHCLSIHRGVARIFQSEGHTVSNRGQSPDCRVNIVDCLLKKGLTKVGGGGGGRGYGHPRTP